MYKRILVAVENSAADRSILAHVSGLARLTGAELLLVHVADGWAARNFEQLELRESEEMKSDRAYLESLQKDLMDQGAVIAGTPDSVTEQLEHVATTLNVGHLMLLNQLGSMPHELAMENIRLCAGEVLPRLRPIWQDAWDDRWWPRPLGRRQAPATVTA